MRVMTGAFLLGALCLQICEGASVASRWREDDDSPILQIRKEETSTKDPWPSTQPTSSSSHGYHPLQFQNTPRQNSDHGRSRLGEAVGQLITAPFTNMEPAESLANDVMSVAGVIVSERSRKEKLLAFGMLTFILLLGTSFVNAVATFFLPVKVGTTVMRVRYTMDHLQKFDWDFGTFEAESCKSGADKHYPYANPEGPSQPCLGESELKPIFLPPRMDFDYWWMKLAGGCSVTQPARNFVHDVLSAEKLHALVVMFLSAGLTRSHCVVPFISGDSIARIQNVVYFLVNLAMIVFLYSAMPFPVFMAITVMLFYMM